LASAMVGLAPAALTSFALMIKLKVAEMLIPRSTFPLSFRESNRSHGAWLLYSHILLTMLWHGPTSYNIEAAVQITVKGDEVIENGESASIAAAPSTTTVGTAPPSYYRLSVVSGLLEVTARLKNGEDLELLIRVLEANKLLFTEVVRLEPEISAKTESDTQVLVKADRPKTKPSAKANGSAPKILAEVDQSEPEVLTLT
jgi:hypothetical protein